MVKKEVEHAYNECITYVYTHARLFEKKRRRKRILEALSPTLLKCFLFEN